MKKFLAFVLFCLWAGSVWAAPGDILYVQGEAVNMREGPSTKHPVVLVLKKGHKLMEIQRQGKWIEIGADRTGGKSGWIHSSLVGKKFMGGTTKAPKNKSFEDFNEAFKTLKNRVYSQTGIVLFQGAEYLGDGIVQVTATDTWLRANRSDQESNLRTLFQLWDAADNTGLPIAVYIVDKHGNQQMVMKR